MTRVVALTLLATEAMEAKMINIRPAKLKIVGVAESIHPRHRPKAIWIVWSSICKPIDDIRKA